MIVGIVGSIKGNLKFLNINRRKQAFLLTGIAFLLFIILVPLTESNTDSEADSDEDLTTEEVAATDDEQVETEAKDKVEKEKSDKKDEKNEVDEEKKEEKSSKKEGQTLEPLNAHFIDVGQADAALIQFTDADESFNIVIDSGDWNRNDTVNYLKEIGIKNIDLLVGTHPHADHIGQMDAIIEQFSVDEVWMSGDTATSQVFERVLTAIDQHDVGYHEPRAGEQFEMGPLTIDVAHPSSVNGDLNNGSIVLNLTYGEVKFLFTGDAEKEAEAEMVSRGDYLQAQILKVGHHGSDTSSTQSFVEAVNPEVAIISVGEKSQYGHPSATVVERYENAGIDLYATKDHGTIIVETDGQSYDITTKEDGNVTPASTGSGSQKKSSSENSSKKSSSKKKEKRASGEDCIDINSASLDDIKKIIHFGDARAEELIDKRPYQSINDLTKINGIGDARIADIKEQDLACVK